MKSSQFFSRILKRPENCYYYLDTREARPKFRFLDEKFMSKDVPRADFGPHSVDKAWHGLLWAENHHKQNFVNPETDFVNPENPEILKEWHPWYSSIKIYILKNHSCSFSSSYQTAIPYTIHLIHNKLGNVNIQQKL